MIIQHIFILSPSERKDRGGGILSSLLLKEEIATPPNTSSLQSSEVG